MKRLLPIGFLLVLLACSEQPKETTPAPEEAAPVEDNAELKALHDNDQKDRKAGEIDWAVVNKRDSARRVRVYEMLDQDLVRTANDYYHAAMVFQHGLDSVSYGMAVKLMRTAVEMDTSMNKWLLAAAIDRDLLSRNKPQIYGTQYSRPNGKWVLSEMDTTQVTDEERKAYGVPALAQQRARVKQMNLKTLYERWTEVQSVDEILEFIRKEQATESEYDVSEDGINRFGYQLMDADNMDGALSVLKLNTELFPEGFNTYDSYGECLLKMGRTEEALAAYRKSLELNPDNSHAARVIAENSSS